MGLLGVVGLGVLAWGVVFFYHLDRTSQPPWKVRDAYRVTSLVLFLLLIGCLLKITAYRTELRTLIPYCR